MGERPDEIRRGPLGRSDRNPDLTAGEPGFDPATDAFDPDAVSRGPMSDPARGSEETTSAIAPDPALGGGIGGGAVVDEVEVRPTRAVIEPTRFDVGERERGAGPGVVGTIRANPLPAVLTGIGLTWLFVNARRGGSDQPRYRDTGYAYGYPPRYEEREPSAPSASQALERGRNMVGETAGQAQDKVGQVASRTQDKAGQVVGQAQDRVGRLGDQARHQARQASSGFQRMLRENPLTVGALAVGLGAGVGLAVPQTSKEHEVMGEARDNLVEKTQEKAQEAQEKVQRVAEEAQGAAQQEAQNQGLTEQQ